MTELSFITLNIIAYSKILLILSLVALFFILKYCKNKAFALTILSTISIVSFYIILAWPLKKMFWGNNGDEIFISSFLSQVLKGNSFNDFYYHELPPFYPPLYFWLSGWIGRFFADNAVNANKIGITGTLILWFSGIYIWLKLYYSLIKEKITEKKIITKNNWFWFLSPFIFFILLDFNDIILKPYETLPALGVVLLLALIKESLDEKSWSIKKYLFFGISGGLLFLSYYFWWFIAIPSLFLFILQSKKKLKSFWRISLIGTIMFMISAIYLIPLFISYLNGMENWQALFFIPKDFSSYLPYFDFSWKSIFIIFGIISLVLYRKKKVIKSSITIIFFAYLYQFISILLYTFGKNPLQAAKPFLFLSSAALAMASAYMIIDLWQKHINKLENKKKNSIIILIIIMILPFLPMAKFIDDPAVREQIEIDLEENSAYYLYPEIIENVQDYQEKTWLSTGLPEINIYLPLHYFIAHNPHFSHHASKYSERLSVIKNLSNCKTDEFINIINETEIDALLLYKINDSNDYSFFFWQDNYPNGGKELNINISKEKINSLDWTNVYENSEWIILLK